jgi:hypothetical protein
MRPDGLPWRRDGWIFVVRTIFFWSPDRRSIVVRMGLGYVRTRAATNGRTIRINHPNASDLFAWFRGSARPGGINSPFRRGPHRSYIYPWAPHTPPYPTKISLFGILCITFSEFLALYCFLLSFCTLLSHSRYFPIFFFSV